MALIENDKLQILEQREWLRQNAPSLYVSTVQPWTEISIGHLKTYRRLVLREGVAKALPQNRTYAAEFQDWLAVVEEELGDSTRAKEHAEAALALTSERGVKLVAAYALARAGDIDQAQRQTEQLKAEEPSDTKIEDYEACTEAAIAVNRNMMDEANEILRVSCPKKPDQPVYAFDLNWRYIRGLVYLKRHDADQAATAFESVPVHLGEMAYIGLFYGAMARLQLARAQVMMGDKMAARKSYQDFLTLWKDADPDIPIYKQAKAEYAKLN